MCRIRIQLQMPRRNVAPMCFMGGLLPEVKEKVVVEEEEEEEAQEDGVEIIDLMFSVSIVKILDT